MNRTLLGVLLGLAFGLADVLITVRGDHPGVTLALLLQAFFSRFAIGVLAANLTLPMHPIAAGALAGLLISLPDAITLSAYTGVLGTGLLFGAIAGWASRRWCR